MSSQHPPLTCAEFETILSKLGFKSRPKKSGTSHDDWVKTTDAGRFFKVTVDCPKSPFSQDLISSMARQAGVTKSIIYDVHFGRRTGGDHGQEFAPRHARNETSPQIPTRFTIREQSDLELEGEFFCVWDNQTDAEAYNGQYTYLSRAAAVATCEALNRSPR
jgi:predicted RNA binding protein YcfA (HicA-like mRNA interferase family)